MQEFGIISKTIKRAYPSSVFMQDEESFNLWYQMLMDIDFNTCLQSIKYHIQNKTFPPTIADIRKGCKEESVLIMLEDGAFQF